VKHAECSKTAARILTEALRSRRKRTIIPSRDGPLTADVNWDEKRKEIRLSLKRTPNSKQRTATWILTPREGMEFNDALEELLEFLEYLSQTG